MNTKRATFCFLAITAAFLISPPEAKASRGFSFVDPAWDERIREAIFKVADTDFEEGLSIIAAYIKAHPKKSEGYFLYAAGVQEKIQKFDDMSEAKRFFRYAEKCKQLANRELGRNKKDATARLAYGGVHGYIALINARQRNLLSAFKNAIVSRKYLEELTEERKDIPDAWFGLGMTYYFASRKSEEEGGMIAWIIRRFITHGEDRKADGIKMIERSISDNAYATDYALSALMWIRLYDHNYGQAKKLATEMAPRYTRDIISRWVLGRVALVEKDCDGAERWFAEINRLNAEQELDTEKFVDVKNAQKMALLCKLVKRNEIDKARRLNNEIKKWLNDKPKAVIEYQDEKNLIAFWKREAKKTDRDLAVLKQGIR